MNADVIATLQRQQANALVLYLNYKKYHWLTYGPTFRDLHLLLDSHAETIFESVDEFAERALMVDGQPVSDPASYLHRNSVKPSAGTLTPKEMLAEALAAHDLVIKELHADAETATKAGDIGTADLYTRIVQSHQKQRWFLKEALRSGSGLSFA
jgi:starvation-inducible DNA-binding protein